MILHGAICKGDFYRNTIVATLLHANGSNTATLCCAKNRVCNLTWNRLVNLTEFSTPSLHHYYRKRIGTTNENLNFDIRVKTDNLKKGQEPGMQSTGGWRSGSPCPHPHKSLYFHAPVSLASSQAFLRELVFHPSPWSCGKGWKTSSPKNAYVGGYCFAG